MSWFKSLTVQTLQQEVTLAQTLTKATLEQIIAQVDGDPLAGRGHLTKREILIDRILAHVQTVTVQSAPTVTRPILDNEKSDVVELKKTATGK